MTNLPPLDVPCPFCMAPIGESCNGEYDKERPLPANVAHQSRIAQSKYQARFDFAPSSGQPARAD